MTDKELLELAAKAAEIDGWWSANDFCYGYKGNKNIPVPWDPLTDDGDALRLAVKLNLAIHHSFSVGSEGAFKVVTVWNPKQTSDEGVFIKYECDPYAATRRAIVRAAAEIGKTL